MRQRNTSDPVEFIGGPIDGERRIVPSLTSAYAVRERNDDGSVKVHFYKLRQAEDIPNRSANGLFAFLYEGCR